MTKQRFAEFTINNHIISIIFSPQYKKTPKLNFQLKSFCENCFFSPLNVIPGLSNVSAPAEPFNKRCHPADSTETSVEPHWANIFSLWKH